MKKKFAAFLLGMALGASLLHGCGRADKGLGNIRAREWEDEDAIYGEVSEVTQDTLTIQVGARKEMEKPKGGAPGNQEGEAPEKPEGGAPGNQEGEAPEIPEGGAPGNQEEGASGGPGGEAPEMPDGGTPKQPGEMPSMLELTGEEQEIALSKDTIVKSQGMGGSEASAISDISEGDTVRVTLAEDGSAAEVTVISGMGGGGGMAPSSQPDSYKSVKEYKEDSTVEREEIASREKDENAILITGGANVELKDVEVSRASDNSTGGDNSSFYGVGAAVLATDGNAYISDSTVSTDAAGGAGLFAYGSGTVYAADTVITTQQDAAGGIHAAGAGTLYAWDLQVETNGGSAAAIRSDRGGGTMVVDGGSYISNGVGSPAVYSTADIAVNNAELTANASEAVCIEGLNSLHLYNTTLTGTMGDNEQNDCAWNVILYQSMSGDSEIGNSTFEMQGGVLKANHGGMFYTTNTESTILLSGVEIQNASDSTFFLRCTGNQNKRGWGTANSNGADCLFTADHQVMEGDIVWDSISQLDFYMKEDRSLTGAVVQDESCTDGTGGDGYCNLYIGKGCTWTVTGDSVLGSLSSEGVIVDEAGNAVTIKNESGEVLAEGSGAYTVTVENYSSSADLSGAAKATGWEGYQAERPSQFV